MSAGLNRRAGSAMRSYGNSAAPRGVSMPAETITYKIVGSPIGEFVAGATSRGCCIFEFNDRGGIGRIRARLYKRYRAPFTRGEHELIDAMVGQVNEYFEKKRTEFDIPLDLKGTPFEREVWDLLLKIPYGETRSYGELA